MGPPTLHQYKIEFRDSSQESPSAKESATFESHYV